MDANRFKEIIEKFLFPLFPGSEFDSPEPITSRRGKTVALDGPNRLRLRPYLTSNFYFLIKRNQYYSKDERKLAECFVENFVKLDEFWNEYYKEAAAKAVIHKTIAAYLSQRNSEIIIKLLNKLSEWTEQTYEGKRIAFSVGITNGDQEGASVLDIMDNDYTKVVSNGFDSLIICSENGSIIGHHAFEELEEDSQEIIYAPIRFTKFARWAYDGNIIIALTINGEILIFFDKKLVFAKRRGQWRFFPHVAIIEKMTYWNKELRTQIYLSSLDVSFKRSGGCIALVRRNRINEIITHVCNEDRLDMDNSAKVIFIKKLIGDFKFHELNRILREELISMDGATIIRHDGKIFGFGSILSEITTDGNGGGRTAAAKTCSLYGAGIKISNDGYISMYFESGDSPMIEVG
jgi:hypothetical protein